MRLIQQEERFTKTHEHRKAGVYYHAGWYRYFVRFYLDGKELHKALYPADDKQDAIERADWFVNKGE